MKFRRWICGLMAGAAAVVSSRPIAIADTAPWDRPPFTAQPAELLAAARRASGQSGGSGHDAIIVLESGHYEFDDSGRRTYTFHRIVHIRTQQGVERWSAVGTTWAPWYQAQPEITARVITERGAVHHLDPQTIDVAPAPSGSTHVYDNHRAMRAPLPAVGVGSIVEQLIVVRDVRPFFAAGNNHMFYLGASVPITHLELVIDAPAKLKLRYVVRGPDLPALRPRRATRNQRTRITLRARDLPPDDAPESHLPGHVRPYRYVAFSTGKSWGRIAKAYHSLVERQIAAGDVSHLRDRLPAQGTRAEMIRAALALVNNNVRYTGLELGMNSIVPWPPATTWARKFGDCKDKAVLLVALLRSAGISAHVALLRADHGADIDPELPGLGQFNHAIVVVPGKNPIWIDPTNTSARAGELPAVDQDRYALVADLASSRLVRTPVATASQNRNYEHRQLHLAEAGPARVVETTRPSGWAELEYRDSYRSGITDQVRTTLAEYIKHEYGATELATVTTSDPSDLSKPFELRLEAARAEFITTGDEQVSVSMDWGSLVADLTPELLRADNDAPPRTNELVFAPFVREVHYELIPPPGFAANPLPDQDIIPLGPMRAQTRVRGAADGRVHVTLRLDTVVRSLSPAQVAAVRSALARLRQRSPTTVSFAQVGMTHLRAGRVIEAVAEFRRLAKAHPREALHRQQLAGALLAVGLGREAQQEARRAVTLEPKSDAAWNVLAWTLQHDALGRRFGPGWQRRQVIDAYRQAIALAPQRSQYRADLATVLEHDDYGSRYHGDLDAAIAAYLELRDQLDEHTFDPNLVLALLHGGKYEQARAVAAGQGSELTEWRLAAAAALGEPELRRELRALGLAGAAASSALDRAAGELIVARRYPAAALALGHAAAMANEPGPLRKRARMAAKVHRVEQLRPKMSDPRRPLFTLFEYAARNGGAHPRPMGHFVSRAGLVTRPADPHSMTLRPFLRAFSQQDLPAPVLIDIVANLMTVEVDSAAPWVWRLRPNMAEHMKQKWPPAYVIRERGRFKLLTLDAPVPALAAEALRLARAGRDMEAKQLLSWAREHAALEEAAQDQLFGGMQSFMTFWDDKTSSRSQRLRLAAAALMTMSRDLSDRALAELERCPPASNDLRLACEGARLRAYMNLNRFEDALPVFERLAARSPEQETLWRPLGYAINFGLKQIDRAERAASEVLDRDPNDIASASALAVVQFWRGNPEAAVERYAALAGRSDARPRELNAFAWAALTAGRAGDEVFQAAQRAVEMTERLDDGALNTLAAAHAARGELRDAYRVLLESMEVSDVTELREQDWLVIGRIRAALGFADAAARAYGRARGDAGPQETTPMSLGALAERWLRDLDQEPARRENPAR
jgi:tetratricopeptide (TPR) repeat protein